ncbi:MAG TPA: hypothetical protein VMU24_08610 [Candidatus Acidoferrales bacterium]|nr:hypothetical protein [Candidatus Acidoferrales bacterium]
MRVSRISTAMMTALVAAIFSGVPDAIAQQPTADQPVPQSHGVTVDPSQPPLAPPVSNPSLPESPSAQQSAPTQQPSTTLTEQPTPQAIPQTQQQQLQAPLGAAAAEQVRTAGGGASRPAGAALAPAKQKQSRSLLIKTGAILAAGIAVGTIYGLSRGTSSVPPNSGRK